MTEVSEIRDAFTLFLTKGIRNPSNKVRAEVLRHINHFNIY